MYDEARLAQATLKVLAQPGAFGATTAVAAMLPALVVVVLLLPTMLVAPFSQRAQQFALDVLRSLRIGGA